MPTITISDNVKRKLNEIKNPEQTYLTTRGLK